ncbi:MAG: DUF6273 domain-containing protein [Oscillospiraceae bacterium]|nr:DUF6273 domain-containing protein [Oscillospiraceae bacterium]
MDKTQAMGVGNKTLAMGVGQSDLAYLCEDTVFRGLNDEYEIFTDKKIGEGGESIVHEAKRVSDGKKVVAKIHVGFSKMDKANRKLIVKFLKENSDFKKTNLMPLLDEGDISIADTNGKVDSYPIDIIPYVDTGEVSRFDYATLRGKIIPELLNAMNLLHKAGFVHRDIKPSNIYMLDNVIILADFGTTGYLHGTSDMGALTERGRGTPGYSAPELAQFSFGVESDYYSLGCTIATLYKGEHVYQTLLDKRKLREAILSMKDKGLPLNCPLSEEPLQLLVNSLTHMYDKERAGYDDVTLWLSDTKAFAAKWKGKYKHGDDESLGFNFEDVVYDSEFDLSIAMLNNWETAKGYLYRGLVADFFKPKNPSFAKKCMDIVDSKETAKNPDLGLAMFLHLLNMTKSEVCPIFWDSKSFDNMSDISQAISSDEADMNSIIRMLQNGFLSWKLKNTKNTNQNIIAAVTELEEVTLKFPELGYYAFMYQFSTDKGANLEADVIADQVFHRLINEECGWHQAAEMLFQNDMVFAYLYSKGFKQNILSIKENVTGEFIKADGMCDLLLLYELFDAICTDKVKVREHFIKHGPYSAGYEFLQKLDIRSISAPVCKDIADKMSKIVINTDMSVGAIAKAFGELNLHMKNFEKEEKAAAERAAKEEAARKKVQKAKDELDQTLAPLRTRLDPKAKGICPHCNGTLKGLFLKKCIDCGKSPSETIIITLAGIKWRVLAIENGKALLISEHILEKLPYNDDYTQHVTWATCTLRKYLNGAFYNTLGATKVVIAEIRNDNLNNPWYGTNGGNATTDKVFLLSLDEICRYFGDSTANLRSKGKNTMSDHNDKARIAKYKNNACWWWSRSPAGNSGRGGCAAVCYDGSISVGLRLRGGGAHYADIGVRPAMWINL